MKSLVQVKADDKGETLSVTLLLDEAVIRSLLDAVAVSEDKRSAIVMEGRETELVLEIYRPGESKNLRYKQNLERPGWTTLTVATL